MIKDEAWSPPYVSTTSATAASNAEAIAETDITKFLTPATLAAYRAAVPGPIKLNFAGAPGTATGVDTGGFKSANFGLSTVSGGPSYFGGSGIFGSSFSKVTISQWSDATNYGAITLNGNTTAAGGLGIAGGASGDPNLYLNAPTGGKIELRINGTVAQTITSTGAATFAGAVSVSGTTATWTSGTGSPESVKTAPVGSLYTRTDGGASTTLYVKESGAGNTGWVAK